jgi:hypothetical protein
METESFTSSLCPSIVRGSPMPRAPACCANPTPAIHYMPGRDIVEVLTKCGAEYLLRGKDPFVAAGVRSKRTTSSRSGLCGQTRRRQLETENAIQSGDSLMDVVPSIIVLAITALLVYRRELTTPRAKKGAPRAAAARPSTARGAYKWNS